MCVHFLHLPFQRTVSFGQYRMVKGKLSKVSEVEAPSKKASLMYTRITSVVPLRLRSGVSGVTFMPIPVRTTLPFAASVAFLHFMIDIVNFTTTLTPFMFRNSLCYCTFDDQNIYSIHAEG